MKRVWVILAMVVLVGCTVRRYTVQQPRTDLDVQGNQGYLRGAADSVKEPSQDTRKISVTEVEFNLHLPWNRGRVSDENIVATIPSKRANPPVQEEVVSEEFEKVIPEQEFVLAPRYEEYIVVKNDTLQKISFKFYGTTRKWKLIYDENKEVLKTPDRLYPGMKLNIPVLD